MLMTIQFFTERYYETSGVSLSLRSLEGFIASRGDEAESLGLKRTISARTLHRAIRERGSPGDRSFMFGEGQTFDVFP